MLVKNSFVLLIIPLARLPELVYLLVNSAGIVFANDLTKFINLLYGLHRTQKPEYAQLCFV